ncbi:MAG: lipoprotein, partial [Capnocytophaga ochracea]
MKKPLLFLLLTLQLASCQNHNNSNKNMNEQEYEWGIAVNTPIGYPIRFYAAMVGGRPIVRELYTKKEEPDWGNAYGYESLSMDKLPKSVDMVWL